MNMIWESLSTCGAWALKVNAQAAVLALIVTTVVLAGGRWLTPTWRSALWLIVFARLLFPFSWASSVSVFNALGDVFQPRSVMTALNDPIDPALTHRTSPDYGADEITHAIDTPQSEPVSRPASTFTWPPPLGMVALAWLTGSGWMVLRLVGRTCMLRRSLIRQPTIDDPLVTRLVARSAAELGLNATPQVVESPDGAGPAIFGFVRPVLLLPRSCVEQMSRGELRLVLLHELRHARCGDCAVAWLLHLLSAVHWCNPLVWWAKRQWLAERELACDAWVLRHVGPRARRRYGATLLSIVENTNRPALVIQSAGMAAFPTLIERRIRAMRRATRRSWTHWVCGPAALVALAATGLTERVPRVHAQPATAVANERVANERAAEGKSRDVSTAKDVEAETPREEPRIIIAEHVILWNDAIVTWDDVLDRLREIRRDGPFRAVFYTTNGVHGTEQGWQFWHDRIMGVYGELFEPVGVTFATASPRASRRFDAIRTPADLLPDPARARHGHLLTADGEPAEAAQVIVLPTADVLGVALSGTSLRDTLDEYWTPTDAQGKFTIHPDEDDFLIAVLHPQGFTMVRGPTAGQEIKLRLEPWAAVSFTSTGGVAGQTASITIRPTGAGDDSPRFRIYSIDALGDPVDVWVPAGDVTISRSLKMEEGTSISLPVETFSLEPGEKRTMELAPPGDDDIRRALEFREQIDRARQP